MLLGEEREIWKGDSDRNDHAGGQASWFLPQEPDPGRCWPSDHGPPDPTASSSYSVARDVQV